MTNSKDDDQQQREEEDFSQLKVKTKCRPASINIQQRGWSQLEVINQMMTPVRILSNSELNQELDFYANAHFKEGSNDNQSNIAVSTPTPVSTTESYPYFEYHRNQHQQQRSAILFQDNNNRTPQFSIPSDTNELSSSPMRDSYQAPPTSSPLPQQQKQEYDQQNLNNLSMYFEQQQRSQCQTPSSDANERSLLLAHEPGVFGRDIASRSARNMLNGNNNTIYSDQSMSLSSSPNSPINNGYNQLQTLFDKQDQVPKSDRFEAMFLPSSPDLDVKGRAIKKSVPKAQKDQQFRFKKSPAATVSSSSTNKLPQNHPLDFLLLSRHNMEIELAAAAALAAGESSSSNKRKNKQKVSTTSRKALGKRSLMEDNMDASYDQSYSENDNEDVDVHGGEDIPVLGDGAQSYSSFGSSSSRTSQQTLTKDDKRRRNTAASARFRIKKKMREQALQNTACEMTEKAQRMEQRVHGLEREIKWLKALVVEKNESTLEQLVRERPPNSTAFPLPSATSSSSAYHLQQQQQQRHQQQQQEQSSASRRASRNNRQRSIEHEDYANEDDRSYQNDQY